MPIAQADSARTLLGTPIVIAALANDSGGPLAVAGYSQPAFGLVTLNVDQSFTYTPAADFEGTDSFNYTARDGIGGTASADVTITVTRANAAPVAADDTAMAFMGDSVSVAVLANDNDPDGDVFGIIGVDAPGHGTIQVEADQKIRYTAQPGFSGSDTFSYSIGDGRGGMGTANVTVTVVARNISPVAGADQVTTLAGTPVTIDALANDNDPEGGRVSLAGMSLPAHGSLTLTPEQQFVYTPAAGFLGGDSFTYTIRDEVGAAATGEVSVAVERHNSPPIATPDGASSSGQPVTLDLLANDNDPDGDALRLSALTVPLEGQIAVNSDGRVTYTPPAGFVGSDSFTYQISDGTEATEAEVTVTVTGPAPPTYANGYSFRRRLLIPASSVVGTTAIADYVMLVDESLGAGKVASPQGNDIRFETLGGAKLDHELDTFASGTGRLVAWVRIASLTAGAATQIMLYYGKAGAAVEANATGVWRNYLAVWNSRTGADRTGQGRALTPTSVGAATLVGDAGAYNGTTSKAAIATQPWATGLSALTVEVIVRAAASGVNRGLLSAGPAAATADTALGLALSYQNPGRIAGAANTIAFKLGTTGGAAYVESAANTQSTAAQCVAGVWSSGQSAKLYIDGARTAPSNTPTAVTGTTQIDVGGWLSVGWSPVTGFWSGAIDEVRLRASATPEATLQTQALNYLTPKLFYGIGAEDTADVANQSPVAAPILIDIAPGTSVDVNVASVAVEPDGQAITVSVPSQPDRGVSTIVANKMRYTAPSAGGVVGLAPFALSDGLKSSLSVVRAKVTVASGIVQEAYDYFYKYPAAATLQENRIKPWKLGTALPAHNVGDTILAYGDLTAMTGDTYGPTGLKGSLVYIGAQHEPTPRLFGTMTKNNPYKPYKGVNNVFLINFDASARHHDTWEVEPGVFVNYPVVFFANIGIDWEKNACNFADFLRIGHNGWQKNNPTTKATVGPKAYLIMNKIKLFRGPHYADDSCDEAGKVLSQNIYHSDGLQANYGLVGWRAANCYFNWIMGQNFFCGRPPEFEGFPRQVRQRYAHISWEHALPWGPKPAGAFCPNPNDFGTGTLLRNPVMIMNYEGGFEHDPPSSSVEISDYNTGKYWAAHFEENCYIKSKWALSDSQNVRYLQPADGITGRPTTGVRGTYTFSGTVKPTHRWPAWSCASGKSVTLMDPTQTLPEVCPDSHVGPALRVNTAAKALEVLQR